MQRLAPWSILLFLVTLLIFLVLYPYLHQAHPKQIVLTEVFFAILMLGGTCLFLYQRNLLIMTVILALSILIGNGLTATLQWHSMVIIVLALEFIYFCFILYTMVHYAFEQHRLTINKLLAAVCAYLVLGMLFALIYTVVVLFFPEGLQSTLSTPQSTTGPHLPHPVFFAHLAMLP